MYSRLSTRGNKHHLGRSSPEQWMTEENRTEEDATAESQETDDAAATENTEAKTESPGFAFGEDASNKYPEKVQAALEYAAANKYEYGPSLRDAEISWSVISAEPMSNDIVRVRIEFMPTSGFRGDPGSEYMDIDASGAILARRQISIPKENKPVMLMGITAASVLIAVLAISFMTFLKPDSGDPLYVAGRTLWIRAEEPQGQNFIVYKGSDLEGNIYNWAMKPVDEENNELVYVEITLINQTSGTVSLVIDESAAKLLDGDRKSFSPVNTITMAYTAHVGDNFNVPGFIPMWGSMTLNEGEQVTGMLVFEMPQDGSFTELRWEASDSATIRYQ
jgi:hypothetical protein